MEMESRRLFTWPIGLWHAPSISSRTTSLEQDTSTTQGKIKDLIMQSTSLLIKDSMTQVSNPSLGLSSRKSSKTFVLKLFSSRAAQTPFLEIVSVVSTSQSRGTVLQLLLSKLSISQLFSLEVEAILWEMCLDAGPMKLLSFAGWRFQMRFLRTNTAFTLLLSSSCTCLWVTCRTRIPRATWPRQPSRSSRTFRWWIDLECNWTSMPICQWRSIRVRLWERRETCGRTPISIRVTTRQIDLIWWLLTVCWRGGGIMRDLSLKS